MNMIDKAKEMKVKSNLEIPASAKMTGIMNSNPFHVLLFVELDNKAKNVGINLGKEVMENNLVEDARRKNFLLAPAQYLLLLNIMMMWRTNMGWRIFGHMYLGNRPSPIICGSLTAGKSNRYRCTPRSCLNDIFVLFEKVITRK
jgi:hypothetical protein